MIGTLRVGVSPHNIPLRIDTIGIARRPLREIDRNVVSVAVQEPMLNAISVPVAADDLAHRIEPADENSRRSWKIDDAVNSVLQHEPVDGLVSIQIAGAADNHIRGHHGGYRI